MEVSCSKIQQIEVLRSDQTVASFSHHCKNDDGSPAFQQEIYYVYINICYKSELTVGTFYTSIFSMV